MTTQRTPAYIKSIQYDRETHDFAMYLDGELVGFAATYDEAERRLDALVYDLLARPASQPTPEPEPATVEAAQPASRIDLDVLAEELRAMEPATFAAFCARFGQTWRWRPYASTLRRESWTVAMVDRAWQWINAVDAEVTALHRLADSGAFAADDGFDPRLEDELGYGNDGQPGVWVHWGAPAPAVAATIAADAEPEPTPEPAPEPAPAAKPRRSRDPRTPEQRADDKAQLKLAQGAVVVPADDGAWLVASGSRDGVVHRVQGHTCTCEAGQRENWCWHVKAVERVQKGGEGIEVDTLAAA